MIYLQREAINIAVLQLKENGSLERLKTRWWKETSECEKNKESDVSSSVY